MGRRIVKKNTVGIFVMLAEPLAVISDHNDQRSVVPTLFFQVREKVAQSRIGVGNFAVVESIFVSLGKSPVKMLVCELLVIGLGVKACAKRIPSFAIESSAGV